MLGASLLSQNFESSVAVRPVTVTPANDGSRMATPAPSAQRVALMQRSGVIGRISVAFVPYWLPVAFGIRG